MKRMTLVIIRNCTRLSAPFYFTNPGAFGHRTIGFSAAGNPA